MSTALYIILHHVYCLTYMNMCIILDPTTSATVVPPSATTTTTTTTPQGESITSSTTNQLDQHSSRQNTISSKIPGSPTYVDTQEMWTRNPIGTTSKDRVDIYSSLAPDNVASTIGHPKESIGKVVL